MNQNNSLKIIFILAIVFYLISSQKKIEKMSNLKNKQIVDLKDDIKKQNKLIEKLTNTDLNYIKQEIKNEIEKQYQLDMESIRSLSLVSEELQSNGLTIPGNLKVTGDLNVGQKFNYLPSGTIVAYNKKYAPAGWAICDGENGTPDLTNRFILGSGEKRFGTKGGEESHVLTISEMPTHNHGGKTQEAGKHTHDLHGTFVRKDGSLSSVFQQSQDKASNHSNYINESGNHYHSIDSEGSDAAHNNMPPYHVLTYIMKL